MPPPTVLAIDPGRAKCGVAVVERGGAVLYRAVVPTAELGALVARLAAAHAPRAIVVGAGTGSAPMLDLLASLNLPAPVERVDEHHTSELARARYVAENPARGWRRVLPRALRTPDAPYDDYVAVILAERWLMKDEG